jgi:hypothetical protein
MSDPCDRMVSVRQAVEFVADREYLIGRIRQPDTADVYSRIACILDTDRDTAKNVTYLYLYSGDRM